MPKASSRCLIVTIPESDHTTYCEAARILARILGLKAPDVVALILHELNRRKPRAIAEEYLYFIGWYERQAQPRSMRQNIRKAARAAQSATVKRPCKIQCREPVLPAPPDPSRN